MIQQLENLLKFQETEIEIEHLKTVLKDVPDKISALEQKQDSLVAAYENEKEAMSLLKKKYRDMDAEVQTNMVHVSKSEEKLASVKNNKEYQALLKEIDDIKDKNSAIEDDMINCLEQMENTEKELSEKGSSLKQTQMHIKAEKEEIQRSADEDEKKIESAMKFVKELAGEVDPSLLADYKRVKTLTPPPIVVPVSDAVCQGCHLNIPPQMFNELQRGDQLKFCPHCGRITYWNGMI